MEPDQEMFLVSMTTCPRPFIVSVPAEFEKAYLDADKILRAEIIELLKQVELVPTEYGEVFLLDWEADYRLPMIVASIPQAPFQNRLSAEGWVDFKHLVLTETEALLERAQEIHEEANARNNGMTVLKQELISTVSHTDDSMLVLGYTQQVIGGLRLNLLFGRKLFYIDQCVVNVELTLEETSDESLAVLEEYMSRVDIN